MLAWSKKGSDFITWVGGKLDDKNALLPVENMIDETIAICFVTLQFMAVITAKFPVQNWLVNLTMSRFWGKFCMVYDQTDHCQQQQTTVSPISVEPITSTRIK